MHLELVLASKLHKKQQCHLSGKILMLPEE
jgi:hypothetical protein